MNGPYSPVTQEMSPPVNDIPRLPMPAAQGVFADVRIVSSAASRCRVTLLRKRRSSACHARGFLSVPRSEISTG